MDGSITEGQYREVEKGVEADSKGSFKLPEALGSGAPPPGKKGAPPAKEVKGKATPTDDHEAKRLEDERTR